MAAPGSHPHAAGLAPCAFIEDADEKEVSGLCLAARSATTQDIGTGLMPDGSADTYVGASLRSSSPYLKGDARSISVVPVLHILCANGIFISSFGTAGWQLSDTPGV